MFFIKSFDLKVMYLVVFVGFFMTLFLKAQYIGYALMLLSLLGIFVIQIGMDTKEHMENSVKTVIISLMSVSSFCTLFTIYSAMMLNIYLINNNNKTNNFNHYTYIIQVILLFQILIMFALQLFKSIPIKLLLNFVEVLISIINLYLVYSLSTAIKLYMTDDCNENCSSSSS